MPNPAVALLGMIFLLSMAVPIGAAQWGMGRHSGGRWTGNGPALPAILDSAWPRRDQDVQPHAEAEPATMVLPVLPDPDATVVMPPVPAGDDVAEDEDGVPLVPADQQITVADLLAREGGSGPMYPGRRIRFRNDS